MRRTFTLPTFLLLAFSGSLGTPAAVLAQTGGQTGGQAAPPHTLQLPPRAQGSTQGGSGTASRPSTARPQGEARGNAARREPRPPASPMPAPPSARAPPPRERPVPPPAPLPGRRAPLRARAS